MCAVRTEHRITDWQRGPEAAQRTPPSDAPHGARLVDATRE
ncbi:hypothetical protein ABZ135_13055 [Streptomyces sp. NPDC006339]